MQPRNFEEPRKPTSARHQTAPAPRLQSSIEPRQRSETGPRRATESQYQRRRREKRRGKGGNRKPALERGPGGATCAGEEAVDLGGEERVPPAGATRHGRASAASTHSLYLRVVSLSRGRRRRGGEEGD